MEVDSIPHRGQAKQAMGITVQRAAMTRLFAEIWRQRTAYTLLFVSLVETVMEEYRRHRRWGVFETVRGRAS